MTYGDAVDQSLRLARKMLEQQAEASRLRAECVALADALTATTHDPAANRSLTRSTALPLWCGQNWRGHEQPRRRP